MRGSDPIETRDDFMSAQPLPTPSPEIPAASAQRTERAPIPESWKPLFAELTTYYRHLPELLTEGEAGRFVVIQGEELCNTWDSYRDALQYGHERFGDRLFMVHQVDPQDMQRLARFFPAREAACPG
jgi:hypothetical protein